MLNFSNYARTLEGVRNGSHKSFVDLYKQYKPLIEAKCAEYADSIEADELRQICTIALYNAALTFDLSQDRVTFGKYASVCMRNALIDEIRRQKRQIGKATEDIEGIESIYASAEDELLEKEGYTELTERFRLALSEYELTVFSMYLNGKSYRDIAQYVGKSEKSVGTALARAKAKLRKIADNL